MKQRVFISHSSVDKEFVRTLKKDLNINGIQTWFDEDQMDLGDSLIEKLENGLSESSHFIIILSAASTKSEWVKFEMAKVLENNTSKLIKKIIPIKYDECEIPKELSSLIFGDLSNEIRILKGDVVEFNSTGYIDVVGKIVKAIRKPENKLSHKEVEDLKKQLTKANNDIDKNSSTEYINGIYIMRGFKNISIRAAFEKKIRSSKKLNIVYKPILLPFLWSKILPDLKIGDEIKISWNNSLSASGHFGGFRRTDTGITIDGRIRTLLNLRKGNIYQIEFSVTRKHIFILNEVSNIVIQ